MMEAIRKKAKELIETKAVDVVIGFAEGPSGKARPVFILRPDDTDKLIHDERCKLNLAVYLTKAEVKKLGKPAIVATVPVMRSIIQLMTENQLHQDSVIVLGITQNRTFLEMPDIATLEKEVSSSESGLSVEDMEQTSVIEQMSTDQRFDYWIEQLSPCIKCYACRAACPMCYCSKCTVECNEPQWIPVASHILGNREWHLNRAMHLAGRCVGCGACMQACPLHIPIHLLTYKLSDVIEKQFNDRAGISATGTYALSTFKNEDKEDFIG